MVPVWVWVLLWIIFFANLAAGIVYVIRHGLTALKKAGKTGEEISTILTRMGEHDTHHLLEHEAPFFTQPLADVAQRYADTRVDVEKRHMKIDGQHYQAHKRWNDYTLEDLQSLETSLEETAQASDTIATDIE